MKRSIFRQARLGALILAVAFALSIRPAAAAPTCAAGTTVQTATGPVCGVVDDGINKWLGIPFAAPPVGKLRWAPPQPAAPWTSTLNATAFGNTCAQPPNGSPGVGPFSGSEDCLFLNVWAPPGARGLPVMVSIHGGGYHNGAGSANEALLVKRGNLIVVSMNYRLSIFGFLANRALGPNSGDYGLQDQQAALRWVQANISAFGGNPKDVTIFGGSAGGSSVCHQLASPTAAGLFHKAIPKSGHYSTLFGGPAAPRPIADNPPQDCKSKLLTLKEAEEIGDGFASAVGCGRATDVAACLRAVPPQAVSDAATNPGGHSYQYGGHGTTGPTLNGTTLVKTLRQALETGEVNRVPLIIGWTRDEQLVGAPETASEYTDLVRKQYGPIADRVLALYPLKRFASPFLAWRTMAADSTAVCPSVRTATLLSKWMPVFAFQIDYGDPWPQTFKGNPTGVFHGAAWAIELSPSSAPLTVNEQVMQDQQLAYVTTFARTGNPTADGTPVWPEFNAGKASGAGQVMSLKPGGDSEATLLAQTVLVHNCTFWDSVAPKP